MPKTNAPDIMKSYVPTDIDHVESTKTPVPIEHTLTDCRIR